MVIDNLHVRRTGRTVSPVETHPPLIIDADAVLSFSVSLQDLKTVAGQHGKIPQSNSRFQAVQLQTRGTLDARESFDPLAQREIPGPLIAVTEDHSFIIVAFMRYVKRIYPGARPHSAFLVNL